MYSLNVPVPASVGRLADELARSLPGARARTRDDRTLVCKRLGGDETHEAERLPARVREAIVGTPPFAVATDGVGLFESPVTGTGPVVYLAIESPGLIALHERLCSVFDPVEHLEGDSYTPHVTIARGGDPVAAEQVTERAVERVTFEVTELEIWDARRSVATTTFSLPA